MEMPWQTPVVHAKASSPDFKGMASIYTRQCTTQHKRPTVKTAHHGRGVHVGKLVDGLAYLLAADMLAIALPYHGNSLVQSRKHNRLVTYHTSHKSCSTVHQETFSTRVPFRDTHESKRNMHEALQNSRELHNKHASSNSKAGSATTHASLRRRLAARQSKKSQ